MSKVEPEQGAQTASHLANKKHPLVIYNLAICATVGGALFGYDTGIINGANLLVKEEYDLDDNWIEHIVSSAVGAAALFSLMAGVISDAIGRKTSIMISAVVFTAGGLIMGFANGPEMLLIGRITVGGAIGVVSSVVPVYVSECAPTSIRGTLITLNQLFITLGIWLSSIVALIFHDTAKGWRYMLGLSAVPGIFQFLFFLSLPESPRYQVMKNDLEKAQMTLEKIRATGHVGAELNEILFSIEEENEKTGYQVWTGMLTTPHVRYALFTGCMLQVFQQFCGINAVIYFSSNILRSAGFDGKDAIWLSVVPSTVNFFATFIGLWAAEALGRKRTLAASFLGIAIALMFLVAAFVPTYIRPLRTSVEHEVGFDIADGCRDKINCLDCIGDDDCAFCGIKEGYDFYFNASCVSSGKRKDANLFSSEGRCSRKNGSSQYKGGQHMKYTYGYCPSVFAWLAVWGMIFFVLGFAPGAGPMAWTINAEIYPLWCRSKANSLAAGTNWGCNYIVSVSFLAVTKAITTWGTFLLFSGVCMIAAIFVTAIVPETKDCHLEEIELLFMTRSARKAAIGRLKMKAEECKQRAFSNVALSVFTKETIIPDYSSSYGKRKSIADRATNAF